MLSLPMLKLLTGLCSSLVSGMCIYMGAVFINRPHWVYSIRIGLDIFDPGYATSAIPPLGLFNGTWGRKEAVPR